MINLNPQSDCACMSIMSTWHQLFISVWRMGFKIKPFLSLTYLTQWLENSVRNINTFPQSFTGSLLNTSFFVSQTSNTLNRFNHQYYKGFFFMADFASSTSAKTLLYRFLVCTEWFSFSLPKWRIMKNFLQKPFLVHFYLVQFDPLTEGSIIRTQ